MCGIAGVLRLDGAPAERAPLERIIACLGHRGPDGSGVHVSEGIALGHTRLSILDPTDAGAQPMFRGRNALVHNGEIYNYLELADELRSHGQVITTGTDTEVILAAYEVWGIDAVARFNGMFAFALWDAHHRRLVLARDRMGVKPMYLRRSRSSFAFASEPTAFIPSAPLDPDDSWVPLPHPGVVHDFLSRGWTDHSTETFLDGVTMLPAAHVLVVDVGQERLIRYWGPPPLADDDRPTARGTDRRRDEQLIEEMRETFDSSVRLRLRSDVPIGTCLSGGLDSSSIVTTVARLRAEGGAIPHTQMPRLGFHARFPEDRIDESAYAELVARDAGVHLVHTTPAGSPLLARILAVLRAQGEPYAGASINAQHAVMAAAHEADVKVLLDGQGADELFGGYDLYLGVRTAGLLLAGHPFDAARELRAQVRRGPSSAASAIWVALHAALPRGAVEAIRTRTRGRFGIRCTGDLTDQTAMAENRREPGTHLAATLWHALSTAGLPALLRYEDRNSMAYGIEARVPFLDFRLVELGMRLPDRLRVNHGVTKAIVRQALGSRVPREVVQRRDKMGFEAPQRAWLTAGREDVGALLRDGQVSQRGWVADAEIERVINHGFVGGRGTEHLWRLFVTELWLRSLWPDTARVGGTAEWERGIADLMLKDRMPAADSHAASL